MVSTGLELRCGRQFARRYPGSKWHRPLGMTGVVTHLAAPTSSYGFVYAGVLLTDYYTAYKTAVVASDFAETGLPVPRINA